MQNTFWDTFSAAPHRLFFFSGALQLILPILVWSIELIGRYTPLWDPIELILPISYAHGFIMLYGVFIFFIFGFLMTVFPRWMNTALIEKPQYVSTFVWLNAGLIIFEVSLFFRVNSALSGLSIFLFGWLLGVYALYQSYKQASGRPRPYETVLLCALLGGASGVAAYLWWIYSDNWLFIDIALHIGLWLFLLPILFTVSHRMLPFFSRNVIDNYTSFQPLLTLYLFLAGCVLHFILLWLHQTQWLFVIDLPLALLALLHSWRWQLQRSFKDRLLAVLHIAFLWLFIGLLLLGLQSLYLWLSGEYILNKAPLHALTIGFISSLLIAMASRVTLGHSGRMLVLDSTSWYLFLGIQLAAVLRILADIQFDQPWFSLTWANSTFNLLAVALWMLCLGTWFIKYAPIYLSRRIDGNPG